MIFELQFENILKDFYEYDFFFSQKDFLYFCDSTDEKKRLLILFEKDPRFINVYSDNQIIKKYLSKKSLFKHYCNISIRLASQKIFRINQQQLNYFFCSLCINERFDYQLTNLVSFGKYYGFIEEVDYNNDQYIFPIAYLLSFMNGQKAYLAVNRIIEKISLTKSIKNINFGHLAKIFFMEGWLQLKNRERYIVKSREGLFSGKKLTLDAIGKVEKITRERVRQIEKKAWKRLQHPSRSNIFSAALICTTIVKQGSLINPADSIESLLINFLAKCSNVPICNFQHINKLILGEFLKEFCNFRPGFQFIKYINSQSFLRELTSDKYICLTKKVNLTKEQKVYLALEKIGKPAHSSRITEMFNSMFPDSPSTEHNVHAVLSRENNGIVWIGIRSTFALEEWGYEHPSLSLFDTIKKIVKNKYEDTKQPVPFNIIVAEMGRYRRVVNRNSLVIASHCNPNLQRIGKDSFIPKDDIKTTQEENNFEDRLDRVLKEMEE